MDKPEDPELNEDDFEGLLADNGGRVRTGPGGESYVVMPYPNFKRLVSAPADHSAGNLQLLGALVRQAGGVIEIETSHIRHPETMLVIEESGDDDNVTTLRVRDMSH